MESRSQGQHLTMSRETSRQRRACGVPTPNLRVAVDHRVASCRVRAGWHDQ
jgi:hypothetical protein